MKEKEIALAVVEGVFAGVQTTEVFSWLKDPSSKAPPKKSAEEKQKPASEVSEVTQECAVIQLHLLRYLLLRCLARGLFVAVGMRSVCWAVEAS